MENFESIKPSTSNNFSWNNEKIFLLIEEYKSRKANFRDGKQRKKDLWSEIRDNFQTHGYNVSVEILDKKFRNLKQTYIQAKKRRKTSGEARVNWEFYEEFEELFADDPTINFSPTLLSIPLEVDINGDESASAASFIIENGNGLDSTDLNSSSKAIFLREKDRRKRLRRNRSELLNLEKRKIAALEDVAKTMKERNEILRQLLHQNSYK